jgi:hypothetical protein
MGLAADGTSVGGRAGRRTAGWGSTLSLVPLVAEGDLQASSGAYPARVVGVGHGGCPVESGASVWGDGDGEVGGQGAGQSLRNRQGGDGAADFEPGRGGLGHVGLASGLPLR